MKIKSLSIRIKHLPAGDRTGPRLKFSIDKTVPVEYDTDKVLKEKDFINAVVDLLQNTKAELEDKGGGFYTIALPKR